MSAAGDELDGVVAFPFVVAGDVLACVEGTHRAVARRSFDVAGPAAAPARLLHDAITAAVYPAVGATMRIAAAGTAQAAALLPAGVRRLSRRPAGGRVVAILNGIAGDRLAAAHSGAAIPMAVRSGDADVAPERPALAAAFPRAGGRLAVFVHGLCGTEHSWDERGRDESVCYGARLEADLGYTPVYLRYNTGLHVSQNGRALSALLERAVAAWPAPVTEIALVGHSMGGLVVRSACHYGAASGARWTPAVRHVVCLGAPHQGAPLEQATAVLGRALAALPETRPFAELIGRRSAGIQDLRSGSLVDEDWMGGDASGPVPGDPAGVPFLEGARYSFVAVTLTSDPEHPLGRALGDLLVRVPSASGASVTHLGGMHHLDLLHRREVYELLRDRLAQGVPSANLVLGTSSSTTIRPGGKRPRAAPHRCSAVRTGRPRPGDSGS